MSQGIQNVQESEIQRTPKTAKGEVMVKKKKKKGAKTHTCTPRIFRESDSAKEGKIEIP